MYFGVWEPNLTRFLERRLKPGDLVIDVGANIGYFSLLAARIVGPLGRIVAVEASPRTFRALSDNIARNGATNIRAINMAASGASGTVNIYSGEDYNSGLTSIVERKGSVVEGSVAAAPLGELVTPDELQRAKVIKIDVEGAEADVLAGVLPSIDQLAHDTDIIVEFNPASVSTSGESVVDLLARFQRLGFCAYELTNDYSADAYIGGLHSVILRPLNGPILRQTDLVLSRRNDLAQAVAVFPGD